MWAVARRCEAVQTSYIGSLVAVWGLKGGVEDEAAVWGLIGAVYGSAEVVQGRWVMVVGRVKAQSACSGSAMPFKVVSRTICFSQFCCGLR